ncbi:MAG: hypothetical protein QNJ27_02580, partial [Simkaniaceae bacterium]|nr:hypothetical protein [Simkaniaceae bacterium]
MKEHCCIYDIHRDCVTRVLDKKSFTWNNPRFQGGLQAFGGAAEAVIGGGIALGSGGIGASVG